MASDDALAPTLAETAATASGDSTIRGPRDSRVTLEIGKRLGERYDVRGYLGEGGMGAVYRAFDTVLGEEVALKVVRGAYADEARLRDEVRIAQKVTHRNVCRTYDLEDVAGFHLVKMEYVAGETLHAILEERGKLPVDEAVQIAREIANGLDAAHAVGVVHRDLKPGNVMLAGTRVVLMDFGLAQTISDGESDRSGTPGYMSPEQLAGRAVDHRSDLYALGCLLYEMLAGERAFAHRGSMTEIASQRAASTAPDVRVKRPDAPRWIVAATRALMATYPNERTRGLALLRRGRSNKVWFVVAAGVLCAAGITFVAVYDDDEQTPPKPVSITLEKLAIDAPPSYRDRPSFSPSGTRLAYFAPPVIEYVKFPDGGTPTRVYDFADQRADNPLWMRTEFNFLVGAQTSNGIEQHLIRKGELVTTGYEGHDADDCGDGQLVGVFNPNAGREGREPVDMGDSLVLRRDGVEGTVQLVAPVQDEGLDHPRCDRDGKRVVFTRASRRNGGIWMVELAPGSTPVRLTDDNDDTPVFTHDGTVLFIRDGQLHEVANGKVTRLTHDDRTYITPAVSPTDPDVVVIGALERGVGIFVQDARGERLVTDVELTEVHVVPNRDSFIGLRGNEIVRVDLADGKLHRLAEGRAPFVSLDGKLVYFAREAELWAVPTDGSAKPSLRAKLPSRIVAGADGHGGQHLSLVDVQGVVKSHFVAPGKEPVYDADGLVIPAPSGTVRAIVEAPGRNVRFMDGTKLLEHPDILPCANRPVWLDAKRIACMAIGQPLMHVHTLGVEGMPRLAPVDKDMDERALQFIPGDDKRWLVVRRTDRVDYYRTTAFSKRAR